MAPKSLLTKESSARTESLVQQGKEATGSESQHLYWLSAHMLAEQKGKKPMLPVAKEC